MERRRRSPDGFIIALRLVIGALILTTLEPWRVKDIIAETIGIGKAYIYIYMLAIGCLIAFFIPLPV